MKNYSLVILLWITCTTFALAHGHVPDTNKPEKITVLISKKVAPTDDVRFDIISESTTILISNGSPIKELRVYNNNGRLIETCRYLNQEYKYDTAALAPGKYAFNIQVAQEVVTHIYEKE